MPPNDGELTPSITTVVSNQQPYEQYITEAVEKKFKEVYEHDKASLFTLFGVFASILTFTSIEIQILKTTCSFWKITGLSLIMLSSLLCFIFVLDYIGRSWGKEFNEQWKLFPRHLLIIVSVIFITGIISSAFGNEQSCIENIIYTRYERDFNDRQLSQEKFMQSKITNLKKNIEKNNLEIDELKTIVHKNKASRNLGAQ